MSRARSWCFTWNNYPANAVATLGEQVNAASSYIAYQPERGESGTPHLQGVVVFENARSLSSMRTLFGDGGVHFEPMRGTIDQATDYCSKEDSRDLAAGFAFTELGTKPVGRGIRTDIQLVTDMVTEGKRMREIAVEYPETYVKFHKGINALAAVRAPPRAGAPTIHWFWGPTGTGKTRAVYAAAAAANATLYVKMSDNKWWDGYESDEWVLIDDYRRDFSTFSQLLRLLDRYPMRVEFKGGSIEFAATHIYITSPKDPSSTWEGRTEEELGQLLRRITEIKYFGPAAMELLNIV